MKKNSALFFALTCCYMSLNAMNEEQFSQTIPQVINDFVNTPITNITACPPDQNALKSFNNALQHPENQRILIQQLRTLTPQQRKELFNKLSELNKLPEYQTIVPLCLQAIREVDSWFSWFGAPAGWHPTKYDRGVDLLKDLRFAPYLLIKTATDIPHLPWSLFNDARSMAEALMQCPRAQNTLQESLRARLPAVQDQQILAQKLQKTITILTQYQTALTEHKAKIYKAKTLVDAKKIAQSAEQLLTKDLLISRHASLMDLKQFVMQECDKALVELTMHIQCTDQLLNYLPQPPQKSPTKPLTPTTPTDSWLFSMTKTKLALGTLALVGIAYGCYNWYTATRAENKDFDFDASYAQQNLSTTDHHAHEPCGVAP